MSEHDNVSFYLKKISGSLGIFGSAVNVGFGLWLIVLYAMKQQDSVHMLKSAEYSVFMAVTVGVWLLLGGLLCTTLAILDACSHWLRGVIFILVSIPPMGILFKIPVSVVGCVAVAIGAVCCLVLSFRTRKNQHDLSTLPLTSAKATSTHRNKYDNDVFEK